MWSGSFIRSTFLDSETTGYALGKMADVRLRAAEHKM